MLGYFRKTMVALHKKLYFSLEPYIPLREGSEFVFLGSSTLRSYNEVCKLRD